MRLLPSPKSIAVTDGTFEITPYANIVLSPRPTPLARTAARQLRGEIARFAGLSLQILCGEARDGDILLCLQSGLPAQGYRIEITPKGISVAGRTEKGLLHGVQTLRQIVRLSGCALGCLTIDDAPDYEARGYYLDVTRGRVPTLASLKRLADEACFLKLNQLQLYIEHTYLFRELSEMWRVSRPLTAEEIMELDLYCAERGIELVPSLSCFGHLFELLNTKTHCGLAELADAGEMPSTMPNRMSHHTLDVSDPRAFGLIRAMLDEFMPLFTSDKFNICADETYDLGKGRGKARMDEIGERDYYTGFVKQLCEYVVSKGLTPMFWGDIVVRFADALRELPEGVICLNWGYSPLETEDATRILADNGARQYVCPGVCGWNRLMNRLRDSYDNISRMAAYGRKYGAIGLLNTDWGDYGHINDPRFSLPGMAYGAQLAWSGAEISFDDINAAISRLCYLDTGGKVVGILAGAQDCEAYTWWQLVRHKEWRCGTLSGQDGEPPLNASKSADVKGANAKLERMISELRACGAYMDTSMRHMLGRWQLALEGIALLNSTGAAVREGIKDAALAARLERWFRLYEGFWHEDCHESELWRIREVIHRYADELR